MGKVNTVSRLLLYFQLSHLGIAEVGIESYNHSTLVHAVLLQAQGFKLKSNELF